MTSLEEIEPILKEASNNKIISIWQVNKSTIRIELKEGFIDIFQSLRDSSKFAFHAKLKDRKVYRLDCRPERKYKRLKTFPWHFHEEKEEKMINSPFSTKKRVAIIQFLNFIKKIIKEENRN